MIFVTYNTAISVARLNIPASPSTPRVTPSPANPTRGVTRATGTTTNTGYCIDVVSCVWL